jgi:hypothetical protein
VEDFGAAGLEAGAFDCDSEAGGFHTEIIVSCARFWEVAGRHRGGLRLATLL